MVKKMEDFDYRDPRLDWKVIMLRLIDLGILVKLLEEVYTAAQEKGEKDVLTRTAYLMGRIHSTLAKYTGHHAEERITWALDRDTLEAFVNITKFEIFSDSEGRKKADELRNRLKDYLDRYDSLPENKPA